MPWDCSADLERPAWRNNDVVSSHGSTTHLRGTHDHKCISVNLLVTNGSNINFSFQSFYSLLWFYVILKHWSGVLRSILLHRSDLCDSVRSRKLTLVNGLLWRMQGFISHRIERQMAVRWSSMVSWNSDVSDIFNFLRSSRMTGTDIPVSKARTEKIDSKLWFRILLVWIFSLTEK
jgi:hypothetical protein